MWAKHSYFERAGAQLVFIGNGAPHFIEAFASEFGITSPILTDPSLKAFDIAGMKRGMSTVFTPRGIKNVLQLRKLGHKQIGVQGNPWQQGGIIAVKPGNKITYWQASDVIGDHPDIMPIVESLR